MTAGRVCSVLVSVGTALACVSAAYAAERTPAEWLERMNQAFVDTDYDGIFSYYSGNDLSTLRVVHSTRDGMQRERLIHLNGAPREIVRTGNEVEFVLQPGDEILELENSIPSGPFAQAFTKAAAGGDYYAMSLQGHDRVADRDSMRLDVTPRDGDRFGFHLWLDDATGLLLRSELVDSSGEKLEIFQFATLKIGGVTDQDLAPDHQDGELVSHLQLDTSRPATQGAVEWRAGWVPNGFTMASSDIRRRPSSAQAVNTMMYTDGLTMFSVFVESMPDGGASNVVTRSGATVAVSHVVRGGPDHGHHLVTVVGEIPTATAQRIAQSVIYPSQ
jgi:sigma-E factor negative regulatory protein RseB